MNPQIRTTMICILLASVAAMQGCDNSAGATATAQTEPDQCIRAEQFQQCLKALPAGPASTKYSDWDEIVSECRQTAYYQSLRDPATIKAECRWQSAPK